jgi:flagellar assembly protein FliH
MLCKVLSGSDTGRAQPVRFSSVAPLSPPGPDVPAKFQDTGAAEELRAALDRVRRLETELAAARKEAFESGRQQGEKQARMEIAPVLERMTASVAELIGMRPDIRQRAEKDVVQLALLIAKRVLHRELSIDSNALTALARVVFERLARAESYQVIVHPQFADAIRSALPGNQLSRVRIDPDPSTAPGTLIIHSDEGSIDASVDVQLEEITRGLTDRIANS